MGIIAIQEPAINSFNLTIVSRDWTPVYPSTHDNDNEANRTRAITFIRANISTDLWTQIDFPSSDVTVVQFNSMWGKITIFNIYNEGKNNDTIKLLTSFYNKNRNQLEHAEVGQAHVLWLGDFNRHHPLWDDPNDDRLFTNEALSEAEELIEALADIGLDLALPGGTPMHQRNVTKKWSRLDQVFLSDHSEHVLISCDTRTDMQGIMTDHLPIIMELDLNMGPDTGKPTHNFCKVNWEEFHIELESQLTNLPPPQKIQMQREMNTCCEKLTLAIQETIETSKDLLVQKTLKKKFK
jgi:endonuclease/exonuclease/phosphatase family metal-dependent hydrolase